ncbi:hypothetical protein B0H10DRAFT_1799537 [Mycena sp. CBHHK59/15]|nr:hypothetical protein B0H10DRAFT_1799537 [Mycena sp. CBHHK59/15]
MTCFAAETIHSEVPADLVCTPFGECEACPADLLHEPFCQPFGSRRLMHCPNNSPPTSMHTPPVHSERPPSLDDRAADTSHTHAGETLAWASCGRIPKQERADFYEFVACNVLFAAVAIFGVFTRSRRLQAMHARHLAARIGLTRR